jgi:hypothetical protein
MSETAADSLSPSCCFLGAESRNINRLLLIHLCFACASASRWGSRRSLVRALPVEALDGARKPYSTVLTIHTGNLAADLLQMQQTVRIGASKDC